MSGKRIKYSQEELGWVKANAHRTRRDIAEKFAAKFKRTDVTEEHIKGLCSRKGWSAGKEGKTRNRGKSLVFTTEQVQWLRENATLSRKESHAQFLKAFPRTDISLDQIVGFKKRAGIRTGRTGRFEKGATPTNKGKKMPYNANSARTQFKKGQVPPNRLPMWSERVGKDGYIEMKVPLVNPHTGHSTRFMHKHRYLWVKKHGPLPEGYALKCLDGDRTNTDTSNWEAVPRALLPHLSGRWCRGYDDAPDEIKPTLMATAKLKHAINQASER